MHAAFWAVLLAAFGNAPSGNDSPGHDPAPYNLVDITGEYTQFYDRTTDMPTQERVAALRTALNEFFPGFYDETRLSGMGLTAERYDARIAASFENFAEIRDSYERTAAAFSDRLAPAYASFIEAFPDIEPIGDIYLIHSLGEMDGGLRNIDNRIFLVFGADRMAQSSITNWTPLFHHELFHVYHIQQSFMGCPQVWCFLWLEGMATYASAVLNPEATDAELVLDFPEPIREAVDANLPEAVCAISERLDSTAPDDYNALFSTRRLNERLPPRFGYYVGMLVAREAVKDMTLTELAKLPEDEIRPVIERALTQLATCGESET